MEMPGRKKIKKRYMYFCPDCNNLSFFGDSCPECGNKNMVETPKRYGLTNLACISMSVMDFEALKREFVQSVKYLIS